MTADELHAEVRRLLPRHGHIMTWDEGDRVWLTAWWHNYEATAWLSRRRFDTADDPMGVLAAHFRHLARDIAETAGGCGLAPIAAERLEGLVPL
jgi:hypothetical protein